MSRIDPSEFPTLTVILPIRNEERFIANTIRYIEQQEYPFDKLEILVVDGQSEDRTAAIVSEIARSDRRIQLIDNPGRSSSTARALGVKHAGGDIITFVDGHTYIDNDQLLKNTAILMREKQVSVLSRPQFLDTPDNDLFQRAVSLARKNPLGHGLDSTIYFMQEAYVDPSSSGASYRRELFSQVGNYDVRFGACEDVELNYRLAQAGYRSFTSPKLAVYYHPRDSFRKLFQQLCRYGIGRFRLARKHPSSLSLGTLIPALFIAVLLILIVSSLSSTAALELLGWLTGLYVGVTILFSIGIAVRHEGKMFPLLPPIFWTIHVALGWGFLSELFRTIAGRGVSFKSANGESAPNPGN